MDADACDLLRRWNGARADCSAAVMPPIQCRAPWRVKHMQLVDDGAMHVRFVDGLEGTVRFTPAFFRGVFTHLTDSSRFREARVEMGAVTWPGELDLAPDRMHDDIRDRGECVLP